MKGDRKKPCLTSLLPLLEQRTNYDEEAQRIPSFSEIDTDKNKELDKDEFRNAFPDVATPDVKKLFDKLDSNNDGKISPDEYNNLFTTKTLKFARRILLPKGKESPRYRDEYSCVPPPIFMVVISVIQIGVYLYHVKLFKDQGKTIYPYGPQPADSNFVYNPYKRYEVWRYLTYMLVHSGYNHLVTNIVVQLFLGFLLEIVHRWWRVLIIYFSGVLFGSLATSICDPMTYLAGASGGTYALIFAHVSTLLLNWKEMEHPICRVFGFACYFSFDIGLIVYNKTILRRDIKIGYAAHVGGIIGGLVIGVIVLKNVKSEKWEEMLRKVCIVLAISLTIAAVLWNLFKTSHFLPSE